MYLKIMSGEDMPDEDSRKGFRLFEGVEEITFERQDDGSAAIEALMFDGAVHTITNITGNCYLMNAEGKTVAHFGCAPYHDGPNSREDAEQRIRERALEFAARGGGDTLYGPPRAGD